MAEPHAEQSWLWRMRINLTGEIPEPVWPAGIRLHGFRTIDGRRLHALLEHGYRRGGGSVASFETWMPRLTRDSEFDPDLCFLVEANDELVAAALCWTSAFVKDLVVHESWRRRGLAKALLRHAFRTFQARGAEHVDLKVDTQNAGAIRLYECVGMRDVERLPAA